MLKYDDLLPNTNNETLQKNARQLEQHLSKKLDLNKADDKWLVATYLYAKIHKLKDYQARSFASELTLFLTNKIYDTDVSLVYREEWIDSHFNNKWEELERKYPNKSKDFYIEFIDYMLKFYSTSLSWKYERVSKYLQFRCTAEEKQMFHNVPMPKPKQKFIYLLANFDYSLEKVDYERKSNDLSTTYSINLTISEYEKFMTVCGDTKTDKFLNLLYFHYQGKS